MELHPRFIEVHKKGLSLITKGILDLTKSDDDALTMLLSNATICEEYEIATLIKNEINRRK